MAEPAAAATAPRRSWWARLRRDLGLRIEHRGWVIWYLIIERGLRGIGAAAAGLYILAAGHDRVVGFFGRLRDELEDSGGDHLWRRLVEEGLARISGLSNRAIVVVALALLAYGAIELIEAVGLLMRRRWAEYLVVIATGIGIPLEAYELLAHFTVVRAAFLVINVLVVIYLVRAKHLFRFSDAEASP